MNKFPRGTILKLTCDIHEFLAKAPKAYENLIDIIDEDGQVKVKTHNGDYVGLYGMKAKIHNRFMKQFEVVGEIKQVKQETTPVINSDLSIDDKVPLSIASCVDVAKWRDCEGLLDSATKEAKKDLGRLHGFGVVYDEFDTPLDLDKKFEILNPGVFIDHEDAKVIIEQRKNETKKDYEAGMRNAMKDIAQLCGYQFAVDVGYEDIAEKVSTAISIKQALLKETTNSLATAASKLNSLGYEFDNGEWYNTAELQQQKLAVMVGMVSCMSHDDIAQLFIKHNIEL